MPRLLQLALATLLIATTVAPADASRVVRGVASSGTQTRPGFSAGERGAGSGGAQAAFVGGEVLVRFERGTARDEVRSGRVHARAGGRYAEVVGSSAALQVVRLEPGRSVADAIAAYEAQPGVISAQPNYIRRLAALPTDPNFDKQWGMHNAGVSGGFADADIDAPEAWERETGSDEIVVAIIDSGVDYNHPDLRDNMWVNEAERDGAAGVDDDGNGYVDDVRGWDVLEDDNDPMDEDGHGTHCAGTIGASADNGVGGAGLARNVRIMPVKAFGGASTTDAIAIEAIQYATMMGADIISCSWGGVGGTDGDALSTAIGASDALFSCAAGNEGLPNEQTDDHIGIEGFTPASYDLDNIISVAATDRRDTLAAFSNWGPTSVDLAAPGVGVFSTIPGIYLGRSTLFQDAFATLDSWSTTSTVRPWFRTRLDAVSTPYCVAHPNYEDNERAVLTLTRPVDVRGHGFARLDFQLAHDLDDGDSLRIMGSRDGGVTWDVLEQFTGTRAWHLATIDLAPYVAGSDEPFQLQFELVADEQAHEGAGVFIDDVAISVAPFAVPSYETAFGTWSGTSMAAPYVTGAAALLMAHDRSLTATQTRQVLIDTVDTKTSLSGWVATGGRLNVNRALARLDGDTPGTVSRVAGTDRFAVAEQLARRAYPGLVGVRHVIVACGDDGKEADPLAAAGLAGIYDAPVVLTSATRLPAYTRRVIADAAADCAAAGTKLQVHLVGGTSTLPDARRREIAAIPGVSPVIDRISGADRYAVTAAIARRMVSVAGTSSIEGALIINAEKPAAFYDALAASPISSARTMPMLAVKTSAVPASVAGVLSGPLAEKPRYLVNGTTYANATVASATGATRLVTSADRYVAATQIAQAAIQRGWLSQADTVLAAKLPDALTGGAFAGVRGGVMVFTDTAPILRPATDAFVTDHALTIDSGWVCGGTASVTPSVETTFRSRIH